MSWSYTQPSSERFQQDGYGHWCRWTNSWSVTELTPNSPNTIRLQISLQNGAFHTSGGYDWYCTDTLSCGGTSVSVKARYLVEFSGYTEVVEVPARWNGQQISLNIGWHTARVVLAATAALPSTIAAEDGVFGEALPISLTPALSGARHSLSVSCAGRTETLLSVDDTALSLSWTPALATYAALLPNAGSATATFSCETFYGGVSMGTQTAAVTLSFAPGSLPPALSPGWAAAAPYNTGAAAGIAGFVQGYSQAAVTFDASEIACPYGASVAGYTIACEGLTISAAPYRTGVLTNLSTSLICTVTDSRGQTASETLTLALQPYVQPALTGPEIFRCDAQGEATENGSCLAVTVSAAISPLGGENSATLTAALRPLSGSFTSETALRSGQRTILPSLSPDTSYELRLRVQDALGNTAEYRRTLPSRRWAMKFRPDGDGVAFGKAAETANALELANSWALVLHGPNGETASLDYASLSALLGNRQ